MSPVNANDLTPAARRALAEVHGIKLGSGSGQGTRRNTHKGENDAGDCPGQCVGCGQEFGKYTAWERHSKETGHARWEIIVG